MDKAVRSRRTDGLFVKLDGIESSTFDTRNLRAHQCGAVFEILRATVRPYFEPFVVSSESLEMPPGFRAAVPDSQHAAWASAL